MKALVTGGNGFLGQEIVRQLLAKNVEVDILDTKIVDRRDKVQQFRVDMSKVDEVSTFFENRVYDTVFHFAAISEIESAEQDLRETLEVNVIGLINLLESMKKSAATKLVFASSMYVFGLLGGNYRLTKQISEIIIQDLAKRFHLSASIIRFGSVYGVGCSPQNGLFKIISDALNSGKLVYDGSGNSMRQFIHITDAARECIEIAENQNREISYHLITGDHYFRMEDVLRMVGEMLQLEEDIIYLGKKDDGHFSFSPFTFEPKPGIKHASFKGVDLTQGLWELIKFVESVRHDQANGEFNE